MSSWRNGSGAGIVVTVIPSSLSSRSCHQTGPRPVCISLFASGVRTSCARPSTRRFNRPASIGRSLFVRPVHVLHAVDLLAVVFRVLRQCISDRCLALVCCAAQVRRLAFSLRPLALRSRRRALPPKRQTGGDGDLIIIRVILKRRGNHDGSAIYPCERRVARRFKPGDFRE